MGTIVFAFIPIVLALVFILIRQEFSRDDILSAQIQTPHAARADVTSLPALHQDLEIGHRGTFYRGRRYDFTLYLYLFTGAARRHELSGPPAVKVAGKL